MELHVDRLTLRLAGLSPSDGRRLAELVGHRLAAATPPPTGGTAGAISVEVAPRDGEPLDALAQRIVTAMLQSLARSLP